ncbi:PAS domain-containing protein, partial [Dictyobacter formicarum]|uniref:PAS domain-containing protein n=1 Tax=Dictyobacter formicarum TaxID=2778368 RepID=UPI001915E67F
MPYINATTIQLDTLFTTIPDGVIIHNIEGNIQCLNPAALELFELASEEECKGMPFQQFMDRYQPHDVELYPTYNTQTTTTIDQKKASLAVYTSSKHSAILMLPSDNYACVDIISTPLNDNQQQPIG